MAFGDQKKKKTAFERLTLFVVLIMIVMTLFGIVSPLISMFLK